ncbi:adenosylcobinamide-phosphate synthase CbiB [Oribacterium sp. WCC10]|uniref:adenosylcobinamide-phosphate synthase CbiB n=1 Tax=Oribacterium sp. WCC10 TaxID=1855343 RepID=UPI0008F44C85|nr:adenosylcobinamide-phosphate synthase CbiB [Oribacterium sp. WCC10]SFG74380.1 adenosylcobinamide-phosphate synthase [Oribacterium sp. WCC10]
MYERIMILIMALILDLVFGDPHNWFHPVMAMGRAIEWLEGFLRKVCHISEEAEEDKVKKRIAGGILVVIELLVFTLIPLVIIYISRMFGETISWAISAFLAYQMLAMKQLKVESMKVFRALQRKDINGAREAVSMIVGRDTKRLNESGIAKAAVETVAENASDGVVAPLLFMMVFGVAGGWFYKAVNTMDSMIGYKNEKYRYFGTVAARLDDLLNFIPARVTALFMVVASAFLNLNWKNAFKIWLRDAKKSTSPNSGQTEAVMAGALGVTLLGDAWYFGKLVKKPEIGDKLREIKPEDIETANRVMYLSVFMIYIVGILIMREVMVVFLWV